MQFRHPETDAADPPGRELARILDVDALRGFALFGILVVNIIAFASVFYGTGVPDPVFNTRFDRAVLGFISFFFETKFYLLFSLLFGVSFTLQMRSAERAGVSFIPRMIRRQVGLWLCGLMHAVFLFHGDILTTYAVLGLVLLAMRNVTDATALATAKWLIVITAGIWALLGTLQLLFDEGTNTTAVVSEALAALAAYRGSPMSVIAQRVSELPEVVVVLGLIQGPCALAMFLIGLVVGRRGGFEQPNEALLRRVRRLGLAVGLPGALIYALSVSFLIGTGWDVLGLAIGILTAPLLTGAYASIALLAFRTRLGHAVARALAPAGRMALSNYLLQSLVCALIFTGYGFGLIGRVAPWGTFLIAIGVFLAQLVISAWWIKRFTYGPLEWLLRALTIAGWPKWRQTADAPIGTSSP